MANIDLPSTSAPDGSRVTVQHASERLTIYNVGPAPLVVEPGMRATFEIQEVDRNDFGGLAPRRERVWRLVRLVRMKKKVAPGAAT